MVMMSPDELLKNLTEEGAFESENTRVNVINYFQGQIHALESVRHQINKLIDFLDQVKNDFEKVLSYAESHDRHDKTEH